MHFEGEKELLLPPQEIFAKLSDVRFLVDCIPGRESIKQADDHTAICTLRPGLGFMRGTLDVTIQILEMIPDSTIRYGLRSKGIGSSSDVETTVTLTSKGVGTHVHWKAAVTSLGGLLKAVPAGLIQGAAQKVIADVWQEVDKRLQGS
jgi:carbon monoxide dehydrogenase subunit G